MIEIKDLTKEFQTADGTVEALRNVNLNIQDGDIYGIIGMSGAGKVPWCAASICWSGLPKARCSLTARTSRSCQIKSFGQCAGT